MDSLFILKTIEVNNSYRKELLFTIELTKHVDQKTVCDIATEMGETVFRTYPFDTKYKKSIDVIYNPQQKENNGSAYPLGVIEQYEEDGESHIGCYLKYE